MTRSKLFGALGIACSLLLAASPGSAAIITWSGSAILATGTTSISNLGTLVEAHNVGDATAIAAGGVTFDALDVNTLGIIFSGANPANITGNGNFDSILNSISYASGTVNYLVDNLVNGTPYLMQFWVADSRTINGVNLRTVTYSDGTNSFTSGPLGSGFVFTGTFTATGTTQNVVISGNSPTGENFPYMNAWQLRNTTPNQPVVPEPASLTLWGLGALGCAIAGYRRRKLA
jgi:hypothetical protein